MIPSPQDVRSRQTAMEAERHWWVQNLQRLTATWRHLAFQTGVEEEFAQAIDRLIRERTT